MSKKESGPAESCPECGFKWTYECATGCKPAPSVEAGGREYCPECGLETVVIPAPFEYQCQNRHTWFGKPPLAAAVEAGGPSEERYTQEELEKYIRLAPGDTRMTGVLAAALRRARQENEALRHKQGVSADLATEMILKADAAERKSDELAAKLKAAEARIASEHENFLAAHRDNMKGASLLMDMKAALEAEKNKIKNAHQANADLGMRINDLKSERDDLAARVKVAEKALNDHRHDHATMKEVWKAGIETRAMALKTVKADRTRLTAALGAAQKRIKELEAR